MFGWLIEPFTRFTFGSVGVWYIGTFAAMITSAIAHEKAGIGFDLDLVEKIEEWGAVKFLLIIAVVGPVLEELVFRGVAHYLIGTTTAVIIGTVAWVLLHGKRALVIAPTAFLYIKLWTAGMGQEAVLIHILHNGAIGLLVVLAYPHLKEE